jgi:hypothetical protein
MASKVIV